MILVVLILLVIGLLAYFFLRNKSPSWQKFTLGDYADGLQTTTTTTFMPDGMSLLVSVQGSADGQVPDSLWVLQYGDKGYRVYTVIPLPNQLNVPPTTTSNDTILVAGVVQGAVLAYRKRLDYGAHDIVPRALANNRLDGVESMVPYGNGVVFNHTTDNPMWLESIPQINQSSGSTPPPIIQISLKDLVHKDTFAGYSHAKFVGTTNKALVFLLDGKFPAALVDGKVTVGQEDASVSLSVSGMRILAASPSNLVLYNESFEPINSYSATDIQSFIDSIVATRSSSDYRIFSAQVAKDRVVLIVGTLDQRVLVSFVPPVQSFEEVMLWEVENDSEMSIGKLGWVVLSSSRANKILSPYDMVPLAARDQGVFHTINQYKLLNRDLMNSTLNAIMELRDKLHWYPPA